MFFFLPDTRDGLSTMVDMVTSSLAYLYGILAEMKERPVSIKLPKFAITFSWGDLKGDISRLGLSLPFSPDCRPEWHVQGGRWRPSSHRRCTGADVPVQGCAHGGGQDGQGGNRSCLRSNSR